MRSIFLLFVLLSLPAAAQTEIAVGSEVRGTLGPSSPRAMLQNVGERPYQDYSVRMVPRQTVTIRLESDAFDPYLVILHGSSPLASNDDFDGSRTVSLIEYRSSGHALYTIRVTAYGASAAGAFRLSVTDARPPPVASAPQPPAAERIGFNGAQQSTLGPDSPLAPLTTGGEPRRYRDYTIQFNAGDPVVVSMITGDFDPYLRVFRGSRQVAINDDYNGDRSHSRIDFTPSVTGLYTIRATAFAADAVGSFTLTTVPSPSASGGTPSGQGTPPQTTSQPASSASEATLIGTVTLADGNPASGVTVFAPDVRLGAGGDIDGNYTLALPVGSHTLRFRYGGTSVERRVTVTGGRTTRLDVTLPTGGASPTPPPAASSRPPIPATGTGCLVGDCRSGYGAFRTASGHTYAGDYRSGQKHGRGVYTWANGNRFDGDFQEDQQSGRGVLVTPDGQRYEGDWRDGLYNGRGVYTWPSGARYEGDWRAGRQNGQGSLLRADGMTYVGTFRDGQRVGIHTATNRVTGRVERMRFNDDGTVVPIEVISPGS